MEQDSGSRTNGYKPTIWTPLGAHSGLRLFSLAAIIWQRGRNGTRSSGQQLQPNCSNAVL